MTYVLDMNLKTIGGKECHIYKFGKFTEAVFLSGIKGGHFADSGKRLAKGIHWILSGANEV